MNLPFKPPAYRSYWEAFQGIYKQGGIRGFFKGNGVRSAHILLFHRLNSELTFAMEHLLPPEQVKQIKSVPCLQEFLLSCSIEVLLHPLHLLETRFIL